MIALVVYQNGVKLCTAGVGDAGVVSTFVNWARGKHGEHADLSVTGMLASGEHVHWEELIPLGVGAEIEIHIIETEKVDQHKPPKQPASWWTKGSSSS